MEAWFNPKERLMSYGIYHRTKVEMVEIYNFVLVKNLYKSFGIPWSWNSCCLLSFAGRKIYYNLDNWYKDKF